MSFLVFFTEMAMRKDGIAVTKIKSKSLPCDTVIHVDMQDTMYSLKEKVIQVLQKTDEIGKKKLAFPALGIVFRTTIYNNIEIQYPQILQKTETILHI